jgi:hypothetical protein
MRPDPGRPGARIGESCLISRDARGDARVAEVINARQAPEMDYPTHESTYAGFVAAATWGTVFMAILLALMAFFLV